MIKQTCGEMNVEKGCIVAASAGNSRIHLYKGAVDLDIPMARFLHSWVNVDVTFPFMRHCPWRQVIGNVQSSGRNTSRLDLAGAVEIQVCEPRAQSPAYKLYKLRVEAKSARRSRQEHKRVFTRLHNVGCAY